MAQCYTKDAAESVMLQKGLDKLLEREEKLADGFSSTDGQGVQCDTF